MPPPIQSSQIQLLPSVDRDQLSTPFETEDKLVNSRSHQGPVMVVPLPSPAESDDSEESERDGALLAQQSSPHPRPVYKNTVCHGRVKNPEGMVSDTWWKSVFADNLYLQTDGDVVEDPEITLEEIRMLENVSAANSILKASNSEGLESAAHEVKVLDLCCGQGRHVLQLAELYPNLSLYGVDQSKYLISLAQSRALAADAAAQPSDNEDSTAVHQSSIRPVSQRAQFSIGDSRSTTFEDETFDLILVMGNSFGYFANDQEDETVLKEIYRILKPNGVLVLDLADGGYLRENYSPRGWEWVDDSMLVCRERWLTEDKKRLVSREVVVLTQQGVIRDQFYQERLYSLEDILGLVQKSGFTPLSREDSSINRAGAEMSLRGEDLGMMEQRHLIAAIKSQ